MTVGSAPMSLVRLTYYSENHIDPLQGSGVGQLAKILSAANRRNRGLGITGALIFDTLWFMQIREGERRPVWDKFERTKEDERHRNVVLAEMRDVTERTFGNWWMGLAVRDEATAVTFEQFSIDGHLRPHDMSPAKMLDLAMSLSKLGLARALNQSVVSAA